MKNRTAVTRARKKKVIVHDIHFRRPRTFSPLEIRVHRYFRRLYPLLRWGSHHRRLVALILAGVVSAGGFGLHQFSTQAATAMWYPSTCLGGWENPSLAEGEPDAERGYLDSNSAVLAAQSQAQLFCGGFVGELPEGTTHQKVLVHIAWGHEARVEGVDGGNATTTIIIDESLEASASAIIDIPEGAPSEAIAPLSPSSEVLAPVPESTAAETSVPVPESSAPTGEASETIDPAPIPTPAPEPPVSETPEPSSVESLPSIEPMAFLESLIPKAYAQEVTDDALLEVLYTLNGEKWHSLGRVTTLTADQTFEIPLDAFAAPHDISKVQIAIHALPTLSEREAILVDSVWLEVEYRPNAEGAIPPVQEELQEDEIMIIESAIEEVPQLPPARSFNKLIVIDKGARHRCEAETFSHDLSGKTSVQARIELEKSPDASYEMEIGGLPSGIAVTFTRSGDYSYWPQPQEDSVELTIKVDEQAQKGDFTVPIVYTEHGGTESSVVCQINVINL